MSQGKNRGNWTPCRVSPAGICMGDQRRRAAVGEAGREWSISFEASRGAAWRSHFQNRRFVQRRCFHDRLGTAITRFFFVAIVTAACLRAFPSLHPYSRKRGSTGHGK
jgi:hypothetical protein